MRTPNFDGCGASNVIESSNGASTGSGVSCDGSPARNGSITGSCFSANPAPSRRYDNLRGMLICPRQGEVGKLAAYSQLLIHPSKTGLLLVGRLLKLIAQ